MQFFAINDLHSHVTTSCALFETLWAARQEGAVVLDVGDFFEGTFFYTQFEGAPEQRIMDTLVHYACPGNHGFGLLRDAHFEHCRVLCLNIVDEQGALCFEPDAIFEGGAYDDSAVTVALTAIISQEVFETIPYHERQGLRCLDPIECLQSWYAQAEHQVDQVVLMSHCGLDADAQRLPHLDKIRVVLSAHCHAPTQEHKQAQRHLIKAPEYGQGYVHVEVSAAEIKASVEHVDASRDVRRLPKSLAFLVDYIREDERRRHRLRGYWRTDQARDLAHRADLTRALLDALLDAHPQANTALLNETCMRHLLPVGAVTQEDVVGLFPFGNRLVFARVPQMLFDAITQQLEHFMPGAVHLKRRPQEEERAILLLTSSHLWENFFEAHIPQDVQVLGLVREHFVDMFLKDEPRAAQADDID